MKNIYTPFLPTKRAGSVNNTDLIRKFCDTGFRRSIQKNTTLKILDVSNESGKLIGKDTAQFRIFTVE
jgi:hypothetical protein